MSRFFAMLLLSVGAVLVFVAVLLVVVELGSGSQAAMLAFVIGTIGVVLVYRNARALLREIPAKMAQIGGQVGNYRADVADYRENTQGRYEVIYQTPVKGKNGRPSMLTIRIPAVTPIIRFNAETWFDRFCKNLGIAREQQTGHGEFDRSIYVRSPSDRQAEHYLEDSAKRAAVLALKEHGFTEIRLTGKQAEADWRKFDPTCHDRPGLTDDAAQSLYLLATNLPREDKRREPESASDGHAALHLSLWGFLFAGLAMLAFTYWYPPIRWSRLWTVAGLVAILAYPAFGCVAAFLLRGKSTSHDRWGRLMLAGLVLIPLGSAGGVALVNALRDQSQPEVRTLTVSNKRISRGRNSGSSHYVTVPAWDRPGETLDFKVASREYDSIIPGTSQVAITTGPGRFGIEWLRGHQISP